MGYTELVAEYLHLRYENEKIAERAKQETAKRRGRMEQIEAEITKRAQAEGLSTIPTALGTGYWTTQRSARISAPSDFSEYVRKNEAWDLADIRASKTGIAAYVEANGEPPPGVTYSSYSAFRIREDNNDK